MKKTAVEWYSEQLAKIGVTEELIGHLTKEAKAMEKQQLYSFYMQGGVDAIMEADRNVEQYYNETFKKDKQ